MAQLRPPERVRIPKAARELVGGEVRFADPATGAPRYAEMTGQNVSIFNDGDWARAGALFVLEGHTDEVRAHRRPSRTRGKGEPRLASGANDKTFGRRGPSAMAVRRFTEVVAFAPAVRTLTLREDTARLFVAFGMLWRELLAYRLCFFPWPSPPPPPPTRYVLFFNRALSSTSSGSASAIRHCCRRRRGRRCRPLASRPCLGR